MTALGIGLAAWCIAFWGRCPSAPGIRGERHSCALIRGHIQDHRCEKCGATCPVLS